MNLTEPGPSSPLDSFLAQFEKDRAAGIIRSLDEYLRVFPGATEGIASFYLREKAASDPACAALESQDESSLGSYRILRELGRGGHPG